MSLRPTLFLLLTVLCVSRSAWSQYSIEEATAISEKYRLEALKNAAADTSAQNRETAGQQIDSLRMRLIRIDAILGTHKPVLADTASLGFQNNAFPERLTTLSATHTGSFGSPFQSKIHTQKTEYSPFIFLRSYEQWLTAPEQFTFMNTTKPYTNLTYLTTFGNEQSQEENFKYFVSGNANKYLNLGASYEILYARGFYHRSSTRSKLANVFGNYQSPRYEAFWKGSYNYLENMENGGITDERYITQPLQMSGGMREYESLNIPTNLDDARSLLKNMQLFFNQKYNIGFSRTEKTDSTRKTFVPVTSIIHTLFIDRSQRSYLSESANLAFYDSTATISATHTADTAALFHIRNTIGLSLREGFHSWVKMGLTAFIEHDYRKYTRLYPNAPLKQSTNVFSGWRSHIENLVWGGAELSKQQGSVLTYNAIAKLCLLGEDAGDFELNGQLNTNLTLWNKPVQLVAGGYIKNLHPDYFLEEYHSNHFSWNKHFQNEYKTRIFGTLDIPAMGFSFSATVENLNNLVYFNNQAIPDQYGGNIQVFTANWKQHLSVGVLNWDNELYYQASSHRDILPLPDLTVYSNLYLKGVLSQVLLSHLGIDCRYHTSYFAPAYMPATGQFHTQAALKVGNYPYMNVYANFHLKRMRFFVMYSHLSRLFAEPQYFSTPYYPLNPTIIKAGLSWNFYD